jgi:hypothetical protein
MGDSMTMGDFATFMTVEVLMSAYGTLALTRLLVNTNYDAATAAWFDLRWPLEGE